MSEGKADGVRVDKWLWAARFFKTRTLARKAVDSGHVQLDGRRAKPSRLVHPGTMLRLRRGEVEHTVEVLALAEQRGSATVAATLYAETEASRNARETADLERKAAREANPTRVRRPTKKERRQLERFMRGR